jgi:hypothetical protein
LSKLDPRIFTIGDCGSHRGNLLIRRNNARTLTVDAQLRFGLTQSAFGTFDCKLKLSCIDLNQNLAGADFLPEFRAYARNNPVNFAADANLIGRHETSRKIDDPLNCYTLRRRALNLDGFAGAAATSLSALPSTLSFLLRISASTAGLEDEKKGEDG